MDFNELKKKDSESEPIKETTKSPKKQPIPFKKITPQQQIKNCTEGCNGEPTLIDFTVTNFTGKRCEKCYLIVSYERDNSNDNSRTKRR